MWDEDLDNDWEPVVLRPGNTLTLSGHTREVICVAAADDGHVLTGSDDKTVKVWRGDELVRTIEAHTDTVWSSSSSSATSTTSRCGSTNFTLRDVAWCTVCGY